MPETMTSRDIGIALVNVLSPLLHGRMFRVYNGEEPPLAGISDHVSITWADVDSEAGELAALNAPASIMLSIEAPDWSQQRISRDEIGRKPVLSVSVRAFRGRSQRLFRAKTGAPEKIVAYVARWFYAHSGASASSKKIASQRAERMGFSLTGKG